MRMSKIRPAIINAFVGRNSNVPSGIGSADAWRWWLSNQVGPGTEFDMESRWLDSMGASGKLNLHDKWVYYLLANGYSGNEGGLLSFLKNGTVFSPTTGITWKAVWWASDTNCGSVGEGGTVTTWKDQSGNGYDASSTGTPTYTNALAGLGNRPAVTFGGTEAFNSNSTFSVGSQPCTYVVVTYVDASAAIRTLIDAQTVFDTCRLSLNTTDALQLLASTSTITQTVSESAGHLITATFNGATSFSTYDGAVSTAVNPGAFYTISGVRIGQAYNGAQKYLGKIAFVGVYAGDITADSRWATFKSWVASYYGLTIS